MRVCTNTVTRSYAEGFAARSGASGRAKVDDELSCLPQDIIRLEALRLAHCEEVGLNKKAKRAFIARRGGSANILAERPAVRSYSCKQKYSPGSISLLLQLPASPNQTLTVVNARTAQAGARFGPRPCKFRISDDMRPEMRGAGFYLTNLAPEVLLEEVFSLCPVAPPTR
jgi:hypothetical protein